MPAPWEDRPLRGALPLPPYDLVFKFVDRAWGPQRLDWSVKIWDFLFAAEAMREFMVDSGTPGRPSSLPERSCVELDWRIHIRCGTIAIHVESDKAEHFWWRNGPVQNARKKPPKAESLKGELAAAKQAARKPVPPRGAKPAPKKARRKLSEAEKLEEQLFGSVLGEADAPGAPAPAVDKVKVAGLPEDAGHGHAADADCDDAPDALRELWGDDHCGDSELDVELDGDFDDEDEDGPPGPPAPVPPAPPAPVSFDLDELGCIPRDAALTLLLPPAANGRISVVSPETPAGSSASSSPSCTWTRCLTLATASCTKSAPACGPKGRTSRRAPTRPRSCVGSSPACSAMRRTRRRRAGTWPATGR